MGITHSGSNYPCLEQISMVPKSVSVRSRCCMCVCGGAVKKVSGRKADD